MNHQQFKSGRLRARLTQAQAAERLGLSQSYLSQLEKSQRPITPELARLATKVYRRSPAALPLPEVAPGAEEANRLARQLSGLGYPGFAHLRAERTNPAVLVLRSLVHNDLAVRLTEALPWVLAAYPDVDWSWLTDQVKLKDVQNRLGFLVGLAQELAASREKFRPALEPLQQGQDKTRARASRTRRHAVSRIHVRRRAPLAGLKSLAPRAALEFVDGFGRRSIALCQLTRGPPLTPCHPSRGAPSCKTSTRSSKELSRSVASVAS
jgi:transcriptional regulator with XRE-family HTH domain